MEKVLITGIGGFLGRILAGRLIHEKYKVYGIGRHSAHSKNVTMYKADILDEREMVKLCKDKDHIVHLAAVTEYKNLRDFPMKSLKINVIGTFNMLNAFSKSKAKNFIYPSSGKIYGEPKYLPYDELHSVNPKTNLGKMKKICEDLISYFSTSLEKSFLVLRMFNVYGNGQKKDFLFPSILTQVNNEKRQITLGDIESRRDYIYVEDVMDCFSKMMKKSKNGLEIYNLGSGVSYSAQDIVNTIGKLKGIRIKIKIDKGTLRNNEAFEERADITKLKKVGWIPKYNLEKGLSEMLRAYDQVA